VIDRDTNAAVNLAKLALTALTTDPSAGFDTGGADRKTTPVPPGQAALVATKPEPEPGQQQLPVPVGAPPRKGEAA
jgi:transposase